MSEQLQKQLEHKISSHLYQWSSSDVITVGIMAIVVIGFSVYIFADLGQYGIFALISWISLTILFLGITFFLRPYFLRRLKKLVDNPAYLKYAVFNRYADAIYSDFLHGRLNRLGMIGMIVLWSIVLLIPLYQLGLNISLQTLQTVVKSIYGLLVLLALYVSLNLFLLDSLIRNKWIRAKHYLEHLVYSNNELKERQLKLIEEALENSPNSSELLKAKQRVSRTNYQGAYDSDCPFCRSKDVPPGETLLEYIMGRTHEPDAARNLVAPVEASMRDMNAYYVEILGLDTNVYELTAASIFLFALEAEQETGVISEVREDFLQAVEHLENIEPIRAMLDLRDIPDYHKGANLVLMPTLEQKTITMVWSQRVKVISIITTLIMTFLTRILSDLFDVIIGILRAF